MITEEIKNKNFRLFLSKLSNIGVDSSKVEEVLGETLLNCPFSMANDNGCAYDGSLLHVVLRTLTPFAIKINELLPEEHRVNQQSIVKVCLLSHLSKCRMFEKNDNQWEIEKKGLVYKYAKSDVALKMGARSVLLCQELGITFTPEEFEAMLILDKDDTDLQSRFYSNQLAIIIKQANELTHLTNRLNTKQ